MLFKIANTETEFDCGRELFQEYADSLPVDLDFQDFRAELKNIDKIYKKPKGALILVYIDNVLVGCAGIRELDRNTAELKRMYVRKEYRGNKIGVNLLEWTISLTTELNYKKIRLDTLPTMTKAHHLYRSFGFCEIESYRFNPVEGTVFMEKKLV